MTTMTVFVCGPALRGEALTGLTVRDATVVWETPEGGEPPPQPLEPILAQYRLPVGAGLLILVTEAGLYLVEADAVMSALPPPPLWGTLY